MGESTKTEDEVAKKNGHELVALTLGQKLIEVRKCAKYLQKDTKGYNFKYVAGSSILNALRDRMDELGVLCFPEITHTVVDSNHEVKDKNGIHKEHVLRHTIVRVWRDALSGEELRVPWYACAQGENISQADGSAQTYAERYFFLKFFNIATDEQDPDKFQAEHTKINGTIKPAEPVFGQQPKSEPTKMDYDMRWEKICLVGESNGWSREDVKKYAGTLGYYEHTNILPQDENTFITFFSKNKSEFIAEKEA